MVDMLDCVIWHKEIRILPTILHRRQKFIAFMRSLNKIIRATQYNTVGVQKPCTGKIFKILVFVHSKKQHCRTRQAHHNRGRICWTNWQIFLVHSQMIKLLSNDKKYAWICWCFYHVFWTDCNHRSTWNILFLRQTTLKQTTHSISHTIVYPYIV